MNFLPSSLAHAAQDHFAAKTNLADGVQRRWRTFDRRESVEKMAGAGGRTRTGTAISHRGIFLPATAFAALASRDVASGSVCGLDYPFTIGSH
jgi:hypothetical protein